MMTPYNGIETHPDFTKTYPVPSIFTNPISGIPDPGMIGSSGSLSNTTLNAMASPPTLITDSASYLTGLASYNVNTSYFNVTPGHHSNIDLHLTWVYSASIEA